MPVHYYTKSAVAKRASNQPQATSQAVVMQAGTATAPLQIVIGEFSTPYGEACLRMSRGNAGSSRCHGHDGW
jgi:hypothetical protein